MSKLTHQNHELEKSRSVSSNREIEHLLDFVTTRADVLHDVHNAGAWGVRGYASDDNLKALWIGLASIRNSFADLMKCLLPWLRSVIGYDRDAFPPDALQAL